MTAPSECRWRNLRRNRTDRCRYRQGRGREQHKRRLFAVGSMERKVDCRWVRRRSLSLRSRNAALHSAACCARRWRDTGEDAGRRQSAACGLAGTGPADRGKRANGIGSSLRRGGGPGDSSGAESAWSATAVCNQRSLRFGIAMGRDGRQMARAVSFRSSHRTGWRRGGRSRCGQLRCTEHRWR